LPDKQKMNDMINDYMKNYAKQLKELNYDIQKLRTELLRHLILVASSLLAILVSLHSGSDEGNLQRWVFAVLSVVLALCILSAVVSLYAQLHYLQKAKELYVSSSIKAVRESMKIRITNDYSRFTRLDDGCLIFVKIRG